MKAQRKKQSRIRNLCISLAIGFEIIDLVTASGGDLSQPWGDLAFLALLVYVALAQLKANRIRRMIKRIEWSGLVHVDHGKTRLARTVIYFGNLVTRRYCLVCKEHHSQGHQVGCFMEDLAR